MKSTSRPTPLRTSDYRYAGGRTGFRECRECFGVGRHLKGCPKSE